MRNVIKLLVFNIVLIFFLVSCEDFFDVQLTDTPLNKYAEQQVFSSPEGLETVVNGMYASLQSYDYYGARMRLLLWPHSGKYHSKQQINADANMLRITNTNINLDKLWGAMYKTINIANLLIKNIENTSFVNKNTSLGQAYFIRAVVYFDLVRMFGAVPLRLQPTTINTIHLSKSTKKVIYNQIIKDFKKASVLLPTKGMYKQGRPLKYAAHAYLGKLYVTLASHQESGTTSFSTLDLWKQAKQELDIVIDKGGYLMPNTYEEIFEQNARNTTGSIFELQYGALGGARTNDIVRDVVLEKSFNTPKDAVTFGRIRPNKEVFSDHVIQYSGLDFKGTSFIPAGKNEMLVLDFNIADPRIGVTYIYNKALKSNGKTQYMFPILSKGSDAYVYLNKYRDASYNNVTTNTNIILFRMSQVLMLRAEVENELSGPVVAYPYINQVLKRARTTKHGITEQPADWNLASVPNQIVFRERIMKEYEYEFGGEGHEWFNIRRRGLERFTLQIKHHNNAVVFYKSKYDKDFVFGDNINPSQTSLASEIYLPIPLSEVLANKFID